MGTQLLQAGAAPISCQSVTFASLALTHCASRLSQLWVQLHQAGAGAVLSLDKLRRETLAALGPSFMKLGQELS